MELVPILSMIVLVATIMTFFLSIGAYVYYKMREKKGRAAKAVQPVAIEAELVAPAPLMAQRRLGQTGLRTYSEEQYAEGEKSPVLGSNDETRINEGARIYNRASEAKQYTSDPAISGLTESGKKKFMRYTTEGFVDTAEDSKPKEEKLRWR
ncbi:MAG: hypothetical protein GXX85_03300 [Ignavibacteria bacterium]|nr:hypothetical protein [Ignavibacteria bacterium]